MIVNLIKGNDDSLTDISGTITEPIDFGGAKGGGRRKESTTENRKPLNDNTSIVAYNLNFDACACEYKLAW